MAISPLRDQWSIEENENGWVYHRVFQIAYADTLATLSLNKGDTLGYTFEQPSATFKDLSNDTTVVTPEIISSRIDWKKGSPYKTVTVQAFVSRLKTPVQRTNGTKIRELLNSGISQEDQHNWVYVYRYEANFSDLTLNATTGWTATGIPTIGSAMTTFTVLHCAQVKVTPHWTTNLALIEATYTASKGYS